MNNIQLFNTLDAVTKTEIKHTLQAYATVRLYQNKVTGEYKVTTVVAIHNGEYTDKFITEFHKDEIFTEDEQILNYVNTFRDYTPKYKGKRNYKLLNDDDWLKAEFDEDKNIIFTGSAKKFEEIVGKVFNPK